MYDDYTANVLYKRAIELEMEERLSKNYKKDIELKDKLRDELRKKIGVESNYFCDLTFRRIQDDKCIPILAKYIPLFQNIGIGLDLIRQQFYRKNNKECFEVLQSWYYKLEKNGKLNCRVENTLDNAFVKIAIKDKVSFYLELIKESNSFPLVMEMLGRWKIEEAKPIIIDRLEKDKIKTSSIRALGYYNDKETISLIEKYLESNYSGVRKETKKVIDKLNNI